MAAAVNRLDPGPLLTIAQASELLAVHPQTLYIWIAAGRLKGVLRLGRVIRIQRERLLEGLEEADGAGPAIRSGLPVPDKHRRDPRRRGRL